MSKVILTISDKYVPTWGLEEIIREIVTNALDGEAVGHKMSIGYSKRTRTLKVSNEGAKLDKAVLLLGHTTKLDVENQRGQFGEGLKLALLAAARVDLDLKITNNDEKLDPFHGGIRGLPRTESTDSIDPDYQCYWGSHLSYWRRH